MSAPIQIDLNPAQREAISYLDGPLLVLAGAGSGKTRVIVQKLAYLVEKCGYSPRNIAAITFTNKSANEMRERVGKLLSGKDAKGMTICTFHALGMQILREEAGSLGYKKQFSIFDMPTPAKSSASCWEHLTSRTFVLRKALSQTGNQGLSLPNLLTASPKTRVSSASHCCTHVTRKHCVPIRRWILTI